MELILRNTFSDHIIFPVYFYKQCFSLFIAKIIGRILSGGLITTPIIIDK